AALSGLLVNAAEYRQAHCVPHLIARSVDAVAARRWCCCHATVANTSTPQDKSLQSPTTSTRTDAVVAVRLKMRFATAATVASWFHLTNGSGSANTTYSKLQHI